VRLDHLLSKEYMPSDCVTQSRRRTKTLSRPQTVSPRIFFRTALSRRCSCTLLQDVHFAPSLPAARKNLSRVSRGVYRSSRSYGKRLEASTFCLHCSVLRERPFLKAIFSSPSVFGRCFQGNRRRDRGARGRSVLRYMSPRATKRSVASSLKTV
jgi:hypothetical protein